MGINNIPPKVCTYSCVYCQVGKSGKMQAERCSFYEPAEIYKHTKKQVQKALRKGESIDYLTFVPDGEPTLDINLGREIDLLKSLGIKIAVITNGSLIFREDVRNDLMKADWVSLKFDSVWKNIWHRINRPHQNLELDLILRGMLDFSKCFLGELVTETMLIEGRSHSPDMHDEMALFLARLSPYRSYLAVPTRPPAEKWVKPPAPQEVNTVFQRWSKKIDRVEYLIGYEGDAFAYTGNVDKDLLNITAVHPMRESAVRNFLAEADKDWTVVDELISKQELVEASYNGQKFYLRNFNPKLAE